MTTLLRRKKSIKFFTLVTISAVLSLIFASCRGDTPSTPNPTATLPPLAVVVFDRDRDGLPDSWELLYNLNRDDHQDAGQDRDLDDLTNLREFQLGTDPTRQDTDGDGLKDGEEALTFGTDPLTSDTDDDGLTDSEEIRIYDTDPLDDDSDDDGLKDGKEIKLFGSDPNNPDSDGDGLTDAQEVLEFATKVMGADTDGDGLRDGAEVLTHGTSPTLKDTDEDRLEDGEEINTYGTDPLSEDTDGDGLGDGLEVLTLGTDPLDTDSDDDDLLDGDEVSLGSFPIDADTDDDGALDGWDPDVFDIDSDDDLVLDGDEASNYSFILEAEELANPSQVQDDPAAKGGKAVVRGESDTVIDFSRPLREGDYKLFVRARYEASLESLPEPPFPISVSLPFTASVRQGDASVLEDSYLVDQFYRWYSTPIFRAEEIETTIQITTPVSGILVDKVMLVQMTSIAAGVTDPRDADTDGDGIGDGSEAIENAYWYEAEHFVSPEASIVDFPEVSNSKHVNPGSAGEVLSIADPSFGYSGGTYTVFVKARSDSLDLLNRLAVDINVDGLPTVSSPIELVQMIGLDFSGQPVFTNLYDWHPAPSFPIADGQRIAIQITAQGTLSQIHVDKVLLVQSQFTSIPAGYQRALSDFLPEEIGEAPKAFNVMTFISSPRGISDPLAIDTDRDGFREGPGLVPLSEGLLTDNQELSIGTNPFDVDSDGDGDPDNVDINPLSADTDGDGLLDSWEDSNGNQAFDPGETDWLDKDTDDDGLSDSLEDRNLNTLVDSNETDPRSRDTDGDRLWDGLERGVTAPIPDPDGDGPLKGTEGAFVPDADPTTVTDPTNVDTDGDGLEDGREDRNAPNGKWDGFEFGETRADVADTDGDGLGDGEESRYSASPFDPDTDDDGLNDGDEAHVYGTFPNNPDTDGDGLSDGVEVKATNTDPRDSDSDDDGLGDAQEIAIGSDPNDPDTDGDGLNDKEDPFPTSVSPSVGILISPAPQELTFLTDQQITFFAVANDPDGHIVAFDWDFDDGTQGSGLRVDHVYTEPGTYNVTVEVTDNAGAPASDTLTLTIERPNRPPIVSAGPDQFVEINEEVTFNGFNAFDFDGRLVSWTWDFADRGATASGTLVTHTYIDPGNYYVTYTVGDDDGATAQDIVVINVHAPSPPDLVITSDDISLSPSSPVDGRNVTIRATIRNTGDIDAVDVPVQFFDRHPDGTVTKFHDEVIASIGADSSHRITTILPSVLRGSHTIEVAIDNANNPNQESNFFNNSATKELTVNPSSTSAFYLGFTKEVTSASSGGTASKRTKWYVEPFLGARYELSNESAHAGVAAGLRQGGNARADVRSSSFQIKNSTLLKARDLIQFQASMDGDLKGYLEGIIGIVGASSSRIEIDMYLEKVSGGRWGQVDHQEIFDQDEGDAGAEIGIDVGGVYKLYQEGFSESISVFNVSPGEQYRVRLRVKATAHATGNAGATSNFYDFDYGAWWDTITLTAW